MMMVGLHCTQQQLMVTLTSLGNVCNVTFVRILIQHWKLMCCNVTLIMTIIQQRLVMCCIVRLVNTLIQHWKVLCCNVTLLRIVIQHLYLVFLLPTIWTECFCGSNFFVHLRKIVLSYRHKNLELWFACQRALISYFQINDRYWIFFTY